MNENDRRERLIQWLETIFRDVQDLLLDNHIFWELQDVVTANPQFKETSGLFTQWMASSFVQATAIGVRRQAKADPDSISLKRFLLEIEKYPLLVSREHYMSLYAGTDAWLLEIGQRGFDKVAGVGAIHVPVALLQQQLGELKTAVEGVEHYVDRRIAHYDQRGLARPRPTFDDLSNALRTLERLVILYWRLLKGTSMATMLPTIQFDWQDIFRFPWATAVRSQDG